MEGHRKFGTYWGTYTSWHIYPFYFSSGSSKFALTISCPLSDLLSSYNKVAEIIFEARNDKKLKVS